MARLSIEGELEAIAQAGLTRRLRQTEPAGGCRVRVEGREVVSFGSCDYLGLAGDPRLARAAAEAALANGAGSGAARLLTGHSPLAADLEDDLAATFGAPAALVFGAGYLANVGVITGLAGPGDAILSDRGNHRSTIDGCRLSGAEVVVFEHNDFADLQRRLATLSCEGRVLIVVEGVDSMGGDSPPLADVADVAEEAGALVVVDDAHGFGTRGPDGSGSVAAAGVADRIAVQIGNLGKAMGGYGAFVLTDETLRELLVQRAASFIFTCALPPAVAAAARAGLAVLREDPGPLARLRRNTALLREILVRRGLPLLGDPSADSPIVPVAVPGNDRVVACAAALLDRGWLVPAIRPPSVPEGGARLRITVTACHEPEDLEGLADALTEVLS